MPSVALAEESPDGGILVTTVEEVSPGVALKHSLTFTKKPKATLEFWNKLAVCETNSNWQDGGTYAGGLGIYTKSRFPKSDMGTWERYGGEEFASSPDKATKEQQIIVANRISVFGWKTTVTRDPDKARRMGVPQVYEWNQKPVGFTGWGCYKSKSTGKYRMAKPKLFHYDNYNAVLRVPYLFNEKALIVKDLQTHLGVTVDGHYGEKTREAHIKFLKTNKIPSFGIIPPIRKSRTVPTVSARPVSTVSSENKCPQYEKLLKEHGLPVKEFSLIMWRESRCQTMAVGWNYKSGYSHRNCKISPAQTYKNCFAVRSYDTGLLQINSTWRTITAQVCKRPAKQVIKSLTNANCNLKVAKYLYENGGMHHWRKTSGIK